MQKFLLIAERFRLAWSAPATGYVASEGLLIWSNQWAPFFSILAAVVGTALGLLSIGFKIYDRCKKVKK